ncbi:MAG TPA: hypothetical protein VN783_17170 [Thermoanaerobaculia bacterium]|nr:hypothetical protein [Thermoanaerobaculia bacterium]
MSFIVTSRTRNSLSTFAAPLSALALLAFAAPQSAQADCASTLYDALVNNATYSTLVEEATQTTVFEDAIDEADSDVVKVHHAIAGLIVFTAKGTAIDGTLYKWNPGLEQADEVATQMLGAGSGNNITEWVDTGDYCFESLSHAASSGVYNLKIQFFDGCELGEEGEEFCTPQE